MGDLIDPNEQLMEQGHGHGHGYGQGNGERRTLRIEGVAGIELRDARSYLEALERAYNGLLIFDLMFPEQPPGTIVSLRPQIWSPGTDPIDAHLPTDEVLVLAQVQLQSPGFWAVLGGLNPLETIRKYLNDRHERKKDRDYRSPLEKQRLEEELEAARLENFKTRIGIARDLGVPVERVAEELLLRPLRELGEKQDDGLIATAEWMEGG